MAWAVELLKSAADALDKLDPDTQQRIWRFLRGKLSAIDNPRQTGKALTGRYAGTWRYRVGDYHEVNFVILAAFGYQFAPRYRHVRDKIDTL